MNWKWGTAFGIMVLITLVSMVYAFVQQTIANESRKEAEAQKVLAEQQRLLAEQARTAAEQQRAEAEKQAALYFSTRKELEELKKKRK